MLLLNKLPKPAHALDRCRRFARVTDDRFFVVIQASDPKFDPTETAELLSETDPLGPVETVMEDTDSKTELPRGVVFGLLIVATAAVVPFALAGLARVSTSDKPRVHIVPDMDFQSKFKTQKANAFFADGRAMRPQVAGTIAQGELRDDEHFYQGKVEGGWAQTFPAQLELSDQSMQRGREQFGIYCTPCHGVDGRGQGMIHLRAKSLMQGTWVPPTDLHLETLRYKPEGQLFDGVSRGSRNMPGYASQLSTADRWAVVLYLRALQRSRASGIEDVPPDQRQGLQ
jgi:mono/diheme cytochrome c family protein